MAMAIAIFMVELPAPRGTPSAFSSTLDDLAPWISSKKFFCISGISCGIHGDTLW